MAFPLRPRAKVRLRLDKATGLFHRPGLTSLICVLSDLSETGCRCRVSLDGMDKETAKTWQDLLAPGLVVALEMSTPPELSGLVFRETEVRWVERGTGGETHLGVLLSTPAPEQKEILVKALLSFAVAKLRPATQASGALPPQETPPRASAKPAAAPPPQEVPPEASAEPAAAQPQDEAVAPVVFEFCGPDGSEWEATLYQGTVVDVSESGMNLEGPPPDFCEARDLTASEACFSVTVRTGDVDVKGLCAVRSAVPSKQKEGQWLYGLQFIDMSKIDRLRLRMMFAKTKEPQSGTAP
ncbi:MAG: PilZ domain-containing protein [Planctomycetota bacterium]